MIEKMLGHYQVGEQLGRGGMGEVYVADDLNLSRKVALKFLPDAFTGDPERMARFEREAKLLASLNHPNIAAIYGLEEAEGKRFLVLELVEGETLAQKLSEGPLPVDEALGICRQIAEGLESAHEKGVVHRDLKPANVMITEGDHVKILDFGLAKALAGEAQSPVTSQSPTMAADAMTQPGIVLGTAAYMSPEQAKGKGVDKRTDIWALGVVLYEMVTGQQPFAGETIPERLAALLTREPDWEKVPAKLRPLLRHCLEKDPKRRLRDIGEAMAWVESVPESLPVKRPWLAWSVAAAFIVVSAVFSFLYLREKRTPSTALPIQLQIAPSANLAPEGSFALSPDGRRLAFAARGPDGVERLWIRALDALEAQPLAGTESDYIPPFFWSPDSHFIAFYAAGKLRKIDVSGGPSQALLDLQGYAVGGSWNREGVMIIGHPNRGVMRISADGRSASPVTRPNRELKESRHMFPVFLPDGQHFLYYCYSGKPEKTGVYVGSINSRPEEQATKKIVGTNFGAVYVPAGNSKTGNLLFMQEQVLMSQPFDERLLELVGEPRPVAEKVGSFMAFGFFSASTNGVLVYRIGGAGQVNRVTWFDRQGKALGEAGESGEYWGLSLSPDESRAAVSWLNPAQLPMPVDIWFLDFLRGTKTRFTRGEGNNQSPVWTPDGSRIIFLSNREEGIYNLFQKPVSGAKDAQVLFKSSEEKDVNSCSSDGRLLLYTAENPETKADLFLLPLEGKHRPIPFLQTEFVEFDGRFSPDMRWVAYTSDESGRNEVYVRRFSQTPGGELSADGGKWIISKEGGTGPRWRRDGRELYYRAPDGKVMAVEITPGKELQVKTVKPLFQAPVTSPKIANSYIYFYWDATSDGKRFLMPTPIAEGSPSRFHVTLNWTALLNK